MSNDLFNPLVPNDKQNKVLWHHVQGAALSASLAEVAGKSSAPVCIVTSDQLQAHQLERELRLFDSTLEVKLFPDWETLPYDAFSPHQDIISDRLATLTALGTLSKGIIIIPVTTLMHRIVPPSFLGGVSFRFATKMKVDLELCLKKLVQACYRKVGEVSEHGEFALRGSILDLYPMGSELPIRIDLFDDEIDSLRYFDPETQRSHDKVDEIKLLPGREFPLDDDAIKLFRQRWREKFPGNPLTCSIYHDITHHIVPSGIEYYLPLFFDSLSLFTDYLPPATTLVLWGTLEEQALSFWSSVEERYEQYRHDIERPLLPPQDLFVRVDSLFQALNAFKQIVIHPGEPSKSYSFDFKCGVFPDLSINHRAEHPLLPLLAFQHSSQAQLLICAETKGRKEALKELFGRYNLPFEEVDSVSDFIMSKKDLAITTAPLDHGFFLPDQNIAFIAESQFFGQQVMQRRRRRKTQTVETDLQVRNIAELKIGDPIVHLDFGVGRYRGLIYLHANDSNEEFVLIEYANEDKLYVPVANLHLISKYAGVHPDNAPLNKLGTDHWDKAKTKALEKARDVAAELLEIYAKRHAKKGFGFDAQKDALTAFASQFPFEETADQSKAIEEVLEDMQAPRPMDRLVCGDVGFGKTEVAMRAAFMAVQNGKQVAVLVPTTLLAQQHLETFKDRFADWPVHVDSLSRFRTKAEQQSILNRLETGQIDIVIGTHKLIQPDVHFKNIGLLIIDEEHRFGVKQKERLKAMRTEVDILTLTATPIPRTLNMAFSKLRDLSIIATPPQKRLSIKTFVREYQKPLIREAMMRELMRGGQIFYLHNSVDTIQRTLQTLQELVPEARMTVAHGQMRERDLEKVMADFYHQRFNVLICTTIIETGIDIPSANTIIIEKADHFGLAQLHQLRGRVGRSHHQAYAYCLTQAKKTLKPDAVKRLQALEALEELGSGFTLATHDLEIRGAGELLGEDQSGNVQSIGFTLYLEILDQAVKALQRGEQPLVDMPIHHGPELNLHVSALIPESYIGDVSTRLVLYKRISHAKSDDALHELQVEMIDRFGLLPQASKDLFQLTKLKLIATKLGVKKCEVSPTGGRIQFVAKPNINSAKIIELIRTKPQQYRVQGSDILKFTLNLSEATERFTMIENLLTLLQPIDGSMPHKEHS